jgi:hypothetical protein
LTPLLHELSGYLNLKRLHFHSSPFILMTERSPTEMSGQLARSINLIVKSSPSLEIINFCKYSFNVSNFEPLVDCLLHSTCLQEFGIIYCVFDKKASKRFYQMLISPGWKIPSLKLAGMNNFGSYTLNRILRRILTRRDIGSALMKLKLPDYKYEPHLKSCMNLLKHHATLDFLDAGEVNGRKALNSLLATIPKLRGLKALSVNCLHSLCVAHYSSLKKTILAAVMRNHCLEDISLYYLEEFEPVIFEKHQIEQFCLRNRYIKRWLSDPDEVKDQYLPFIFEQAQKYYYSPEIVMKGLVTSWMT